MNIFSAALKSFNPPAAYADAAFNWKWKAIAYFIFLCVIAAAAGALMSAKYVGDFYDNYAAPAMADMDKIEISTSGVKTPDGKPVELKSKSGKVFAIATPDRLDAAKVKGLLFSIEGDRISIYASGLPEQSIPLDSAVANGETVKLSEMFPSKNAMLFAILPTLYLATAAFMNIIYILAMGLAAKTLALTAMPSLGYLKCVKIALIAITPPTLIDLLVMAVAGTPMPGIIFATITGVLVWLAVRAMSKNAQN